MKSWIWLKGLSWQRDKAWEISCCCFGFFFFSSFPSFFIELLVMLTRGLECRKGGGDTNLPLSKLNKLFQTHLFQKKGKQKKSLCYIIPSLGAVTYKSCCKNRPLHTHFQKTKYLSSRHGFGTIPVNLVCLYIPTLYLYFQMYMRIGRLVVF